MSFLPFPRTVYKGRSKISGEIVVKEQFGRYTLHVQNLIQSGGIVKGIWKRPLKKVTKAERVLVLGLGGGTVVQLIKEQFPEAKIIGIEIDPEIIKVSKKYFGLNEIKDLQVINQDAIDWIKNYQGKRFDLILVDLYIGGEFLREAMNNEFLKNLKKNFTKQGKVIFNWLKNKDEKVIKEKIATNFSKIILIDLKTNLFLISRP